MTEAAEVHIVRLPTGREVRVPGGETPQMVWQRHCGMSVTEGICPVHLIPLAPVAARPGSGVITGARCRQCGFWSLTSDQAVSWDTDHDPHDGRPMTPAWVAREGPRA